jgi:hypothetical protein
MYITSLLAERILVKSCMSMEFIAFICHEVYNDEVIVKAMKFYFQSNAEWIEQLERIERLMIDNRKIAHRKHKDKLDLIALGKYRSMINVMRKTFSTYLDDRLKHLKLMELVPFIKEKIWDMDFPLFTAVETEEDPYIPELTKTMSEQEYILLFDDVVEEFFTCEDYDVQKNHSCDFIKIPLWGFPMFTDVTYPQLKYTRDLMKPVLAGFNDNLKQLTGQLLQMQYTPENQADIKQLCCEKLQSHRQPIQQALDESIYLSRLKNVTAGNNFFTFCLGITSVENIVRYFEKTEIVQPYVVSQIIHQLGRQINVNSTFMFSYILVK